MPIFSRLIEDGQGRIWVGSINDGVVCFDPKTGKYRNFVHNDDDPESISFNIIRTFTLDKSGNLWIGTDGGGISKVNLKPKNFETYRVNRPKGRNFSSNFVKCLYQADDGKIWFGTHEKGINIFNPATNQTEILTWKSEKGLSCSFFDFDKQGRFFVSRNDGLFYLDQKTKTFEPIRIVDSVLQLRGINFGYSGIFTQKESYLLASSVGLIYGDGTGKLANLKLLPNSKAGYFRVFQSTDGIIWAATSDTKDYVIYRFKETYKGHFERFDTVNIHSRVRYFYQSPSSNIVWIGS